MTETGKDMQHLGQLIGDNLRIPTVPVVASRALSEIANPKASTRDIGRILEKDQGLTARMLAVANSSAFAPRREITCIETASVLLGMTKLKNLIVAASCRRLYKRFGKTERTLWEHSVLCALAASTVSKALDLDCVEEAFVAGLMHDVGKVIMNNGAREQYAESLRVAKVEQMLDFDAEHKVFGFNHMDVGALLVQRWRLSEALFHVAAFHHDPETVAILSEDHADICRATYLANLISHVIEGEIDSLDEDDPVLAEMGLETEQLEAITDEVRTQYQEERQALAA